ncbi:MAG: hypothetical protein V4736_04985 [Bdellovibrionota bacterium]
MKNVMLGAIALLLFAGCGQTITGVLKTADHKPMVIKLKENEKTAITNGRLKVKLYEGSLVTDSTLEIKTMKNKMLAKIVIPKAAVLSAYSFQISHQETNQDFDIIGKLRETDEKVSESKDTDKCTFCGVCMMPDAASKGTLKGSIAGVQYSLQSSCECEGTKDVIREKKTWIQHVSINFKNVKSTTKDALFTADPIPRVEFRIVKELTACGDGLLD